MPMVLFCNLDPLTSIFARYLGPFMHKTHFVHRPIFVRNLGDKINRLSKNFFSSTYVKKSCETMKRSRFILKQFKPFYVALLLWLSLNNPHLKLLLLQERIVAYPLRYLSRTEKVLSANCQRTFSELLTQSLQLDSFWKAVCC